MTPLFLYVDCETIPSQNPAVLDRIMAEHVVAEPDLSAIVADGRLSDPARIEADLAKKREKALADHEIDLAKAAAKCDVAYRKTCLAGATAHIATIHYAFGDDEVAGHLNEALEQFDGAYKVPTFAQVLTGEREMLKAFFDELRQRIREIADERVAAEWTKVEALGAREGLRTMGRDAWIEQSRDHYLQVPVVVAHSAEFDVRMIWQRARVLGITPPIWWPIDYSRYRTDQVQDTMTMWAGHQDRISLDDLCVALGIPGKGDGLDGSQVWNAVQQGRVWDVFRYCGEDVERCRAVHKRLRGENPRRQFEITVFGKPWSEATQEAAADYDGMFDAAAAAADRDHGAAAE